MKLKNVHHRLTMAYHPELGVTYMPNSIIRLPLDEDSHIIKTNKQGFR